MGDFVGERAGRDSGLEVAQRAEGGEIEAASEVFAGDDVVEGVQLANLRDVRRRVPEIRAREILHARGRSVIDDERRAGLRFDGEKKVRAHARPGGAVLELFFVEGRGDGVAEFDAVRFGFRQRDQLRGGGFIGGE